MNDPMRDFFKDLPPDGPDPLWIDATRRRLLERVSAKRRRYRRATAGWVAALAVSAAVLLMLVLLPSSGVSFAGVQRSIERAQTIQCYSTLTLVQDKAEIPLSTAHSWADRDLGARLDIQALGMPLAQFWLPRQGQPILVDHTHRAIVPIHLPDELDARALLRFDPTTVVRQLGRVSSDIKPIPGDGSAQTNEIGFRVSAQAVGLSEASTLDIWVDTSTQLPRRIVIHVPLSDRDALVWQLDRFTWYGPIQAGVLLADLPADYERIDPLVVPTPGEAPLVRTLGRYASLKRGRFPVTEMVAWEGLAKMVMTALKPVSAWRDLPEPMNSEQGQREAVGDAIAGGLFCFQLQENGAEPEYFGARVRLGDEQTLMRWRQPDGSTRLINGQLKSETMP